MKFTVQQEQVITTQNCNLLVSAAAGSGKTAVLVERIIRLISDSQNPVSIDQLLIVTFTNKAAAEMKERISHRIEQQINQTQDMDLIRHLNKQITLLNIAHITTIHSFCLDLIRNYYHLLGLEPQFRIGNETELALLKEESMQQMLEQEYTPLRPDFVKVVESYAPGKTDAPLIDIINNIYRHAISNPWPTEWLEAGLHQLQLDTLTDMYNSPFYQILIDYGRELLEAAAEHFNQLDQLLQMNEGPTKYADTIEELRNYYETTKKQIETADYKAIRDFGDLDIPPLSRKRKGFNPELAGQAKDIINQLRTDFKSLALLRRGNEDLTELKGVRENMVELAGLTRSFIDRFGQAKREKNIIDFNDFEHFALQILYHQKQPSAIAQKYKDKFIQVLVDEYQDTNEVQEQILLSVSRQKQPTNNLFMVGDLKQSIYKFRLAKPEIFSRKYETYGCDLDNQKIELAKNFRSRRQVLDFANHVFAKIMSRQVGDVDYNDQVRLYYGADYYPETGFDYRPEVILLDDATSQYADKAEVQSIYVADTINELIAGQELQVWDKESGQIRPVAYQDIAIIARSSAIINQMVEVFEQKAIPYHYKSVTGYFEAIEVQVVMNLLKVIDNPYQDIPVAAVLRAPFIRMTEVEMLEVRAVMEEGLLYEALVYGLDQEMLSQSVRDKAKRFVELTQQLRQFSRVMPVYQLMEQIYQKTGYHYFVALMENGEQRRTNLDFLVVQSKQFEKSSYKGLFHFIRYIEHIKKYNVEVQVASAESQSAVSLMTIHKSKGLEFPVLFLVDSQKQFNQMDLRGSFVIDQELGIGSDYINPQERYRKDSLVSQAIKLKAKRELLSEELRLLYVALTRCREKLYIVGYTADYQKKVEPKINSAIETEKKIASFIVGQAKSYLDWILLCLSPAAEPYYQLKIIQPRTQDQLMPAEAITIEKRKDLLAALQAGRQVMPDQDRYQELTRQYPYQEATRQPVSMTVSELKKVDLVDRLTGDQAEEGVPAERKIPRFVTSQKQEQANYGTVMHQIMKLLPLQKEYRYSELEEQIEQYFEQALLAADFRNRIRIQDIYRFCRTDFYQRMVAADQRHQLYREKSFVLGIWQQGERRMIQGMIDLYFYEGDQIVLLDYKTDRITGDLVTAMTTRYQTQIHYYRQALEQATGKQVTESYVYSFDANQLVSL